MKKNIKLVLVFILGIFSAIGLTVVATNINGKNIKFNADGWNVNNVEEAIEYLKDQNVCDITAPKVPKIANVISGDKNTVGSIVRIGNEDFYIIGKGTGDEEGKTKLLTRYYLGNNNNQSSTYVDRKFSSSAYWSGQVGDGKKYPGSYSGSPKPYVYDSNCNHYSYINNYVKKISNMGISNVSGRLLNYEEAITLSSSILSLGQRYNTGSAYDDNGTYYITESGQVVTSDGAYNGAYYGNRPTRPVILIPTNEIGNAV